MPGQRILEIVIVAILPYRLGDVSNQIDITGLDLAL
jgi:hypothetical protein